MSSQQVVVFHTRDKSYRRAKTHLSHQVSEWQISDAERYTFLKQLEAKYIPNPSYLTNQPTLNQQIRIILIDWLMEIVKEYKLSARTLAWAVAYLDLFSSTCCIDRTRYQLIGVTVFWLATKMESAQRFDVDWCKDVCVDQYTRKEHLQTEWMVLSQLQCGLMVSTVLDFVYLSFARITSPKLQALLEWLAQLSLFSYPLLQFPHSLVACAIVYAVEQDIYWLDYFGVQETPERVFSCTIVLQQTMEEMRQNKYQTIFLRCPDPLFRFPIDE